MSVGVTIGVACGIALLFALFFAWLARRSFKKFEREVELNTPLIDSDDRRLDAALRDAEEGFIVCDFCAFENFKRVRFCTLCGEPIVEKAPFSCRSPSRNKGERRRLTRMLSTFKRHTGTQTTSSTALSISSKQATRRRVRAQRRKEWTRKLDVEGRPYWFRDSHNVGADTPATGFVVEFKPANSRIAVDGKSPEAHASTSRSSSEPDPELEHTEGNKEYAANRAMSPRPMVRSVAECAASLVNYAQEMHSVFTSAADADMDATRLPLTLPNSPIRTALGTDTVLGNASPPPLAMALASKDFPSKYAHFVMAASALLVPAEREHLRLNVERASVFKDSMESLAIIPLQNARSVVRINFLDENGVDAGGLQREWFVMLNEALVDPVRGLFVCANKRDQTYYMSPCSDMELLPNQLLNLFAAGRLLGRALLEGSMLCFHLASPFLKLILGYPLSFEDLEDLDPEVYSNLRWLLENDNVDALDLDFTVTTKDGDSYRDIELVPGGSAIPVTDSNKREFVELKWQYLLVESVAPQLQVFLQGLYEIVPRELLLLFDPEEFDFLLCGSDEIDVDDWERNTKYSEDLHHHRSLKWFWELVREMPNEYRRRLLQFSTGSSRVPLGGFSALTSYDGRLCPFTLKAVSLIGDGFIHSHACFNRLDLPLHVVRDELKAVLYAVLETEVYGFTTD
ncbi:E3 ubiquitin-protein ligase Itchy-like protein [Phytophthora ramorum]|nr:E3 ubiquitin-protein ligase Itchy-like protein [Phytophthora ramorum]